MRTLLPAPRWALTPPFHPGHARGHGGLFSVALSVRLPCPGVTRHRCFGESGLSSHPGRPGQAAVRPSAPARHRKPDLAGQCLIRVATRSCPGAAALAAPMTPSPSDPDSPSAHYRRLLRAQNIPGVRPTAEGAAPPLKGRRAYAPSAPSAASGVPTASRAARGLSPRAAPASADARHPRSPAGRPLESFRP